MRDYELTVLLQPGLSEKELDKEVKALSDSLEKASVKIQKKKDPVKKSLAYEIKKQREAFYVYFELENDPAKASDVDQKLRLAENVIRYLYVSKVA